MLLDDERHVIKWLSQYGALTKTQVIRLLRDKTPETAEKILRNLKREHQISDVAGGYYTDDDGGQGQNAHDQMKDSGASSIFVGCVCSHDSKPSIIPPRSA